MFAFQRLSAVIHFWILLNVTVCFGFYLPGLAPVNYCRESEASPQCKVSDSMHHRNKSHLIWFNEIRSLSKFVRFISSELVDLLRG